MQHVADLVAGAAEPAIGEGAAIKVPRRPQHKKALVDLAHLPGPGQDAAAVDDRPRPKGGVIFLDQQFRGELARAVKRAGARRQEIFADAALGPPSPISPGCDDQPIAFAPQRQPAQRRNRVDPAGRQKIIALPWRRA